MNEPSDQGFVPPPPPDQVAAEGNPWEQRERLGFGAALVESVKLFAVNPTEAFARTRRQGDFASPLLFAVIVGWACALVGRIWQFLFQGSFLSFLPPELRDQMAFFMAGSVFGLIIEMILWPVFIVIGLFIAAAVFHVSLLIVGGLNDSKSGFEGTFRVCSYSHVAQLAQVIPIVGALISIIWWLILVTIGAASLHGTSRGKAVVAALIPFVICCVCIGFCIMLVLGAISSLDQ